MEKEIHSPYDFIELNTVGTDEISIISKEELLKLNLEKELNNKYKKFFRELPNFFYNYNIGFSSNSDNLICYNQNDSYHMEFKNELIAINFDNLSSNQDHYSKKDVVFNIIEALADNLTYELNFLDKFFKFNLDNYSNNNNSRTKPYSAGNIHDYNKILNNIIKDMYDHFLFKKSKLPRLIYRLKQKLFKAPKNITYPIFYNNNTILNEFKENKIWKTIEDRIKDNFEEYKDRKMDKVWVIM